MRFEETTLGAISLNIQTGPFGSQLHQSDYSEMGNPVVMPKDLMNGKIMEESIARVSFDHVARLCRHKIQKNDILYSRRGDVGRCAYATEIEEGWLCGTGCLRVTIDGSKANPRYVFYRLQMPNTVGWVVNHAVGSTMLNLNTSILSSVPLQLPSIEEQQKVVSIISAYDDLIANNQKQIRLLEEAAQRLYKEWFVDLRFPGYEATQIVEGVPEGWNKKIVGDIIDKSYRSKQVMTSQYLKEGKFPIIDQSRDFIAGYTNDDETLVCLNKPVIVFGDHTRALKYIQFPFAKGADGTQLIVSKYENMPQPLLYLSLLNIDLSNYHYARHFKYLKAEEIIVPDVAVAGAFVDLVNPIFQKIQIMREQIKNGQQARDYLLAKLMSGALEV